MTKGEQAKVTLTPDQLVIAHVAMEENQMKELMEIICDTFNASTKEVECARSIKEQVDKKYGGRWHCVVGRHFASHVAYADNKYLFVKAGKECCLIFQSGGLEGEEKNLPD